MGIGSKDTICDGILKQQQDFCVGNETRYTGVALYLELQGYGGTRFTHDFSFIKTAILTNTTIKTVHTASPWLSPPKLVLGLYSIHFLSVITEAHGTANSKIDATFLYQADMTEYRLVHGK